MKPVTIYYLVLLTVISIYFTVSKFLFDEVYHTIHIIIDEYFHIPQGLEYCKQNFGHWDPKITTLPGLYIITAIFLGTYAECNTYNLRFINFVASGVNLVLLSSILNYVYGNTNPLKTVLQALNIAILPPLYFFSFVYYTDTLSLTFLLMFSRLCFTNQYKILMLVLGFGSVLMRQTNIVWIAMVFGHKTLDILIRSSRVFGNQYLSTTKLSRQSLIARDVDASKLRRYYSLSDAYTAIKYHISTCFVTFFKFLTLHDWLTLISHCIVLATFSAFVYANGSIVVGDKKAHEATIHLPQLLYFLLFYGVFGLPYVVNRFNSTLTLIMNSKLKVFLLSMVILLIVHFNTVTHPYLLADNRHYTFYIWNRWFGKYSYAIYATVPAYIFLLFSLYDNLKDQNCVSFLLPYTISVTLALALQKLIEVRYFIIPYIILRLRFGRPSFIVVIAEFLWYVCINAAMFFVFFDKEIMWTNFDYAQRIIW